LVNSFVKIESGGSVTPSYDPNSSEGGNLVAGLKSKVAFRVTDASGKELSLTGQLLMIITILLPGSNLLRLVLAISILHLMPVKNIK